MPRLEHVNSFRDLVVYRRSRELSHRIFVLSKGFSLEERFSLPDQIRRSSRSVGAQIAEAWAKRRHENHFRSKLTDADGEQQETQHRIEVCRDCAYISDTDAADLLGACTEIGRMIGGMISKAAFCNPDALELHEDSAPYFLDPHADLNAEH